MKAGIPMYQSNSTDTLVTIWFKSRGRLIGSVSRLSHVLC
jgi:hypothetical protein